MREWVKVFGNWLELLHFSDDRVGVYNPPFSCGPFELPGEVVEVSKKYVEGWKVTC